MCILFVYRNPNAIGNSYRLIVATNRDEYFSRPAKIAHYWKNHPDCLGGTDQEPTKEGGTWLAISKRGKAGVLLNLSEIPENNTENGSGETAKKGRGYLVTNFVSSCERAEDYLTRLHEENMKYQTYNPYTLVLLDLKTASVSFINSSLKCKGPVLSSKDTILGFGNTAVECAYNKVVRGKEIFSKIISEFRKNEETLIEKLIQFLKSKEKHLPDEVMTAIHPEGYKELSSVFVDSESKGYGTRTHTVILVNALNQVTFVEETRNADKTWSRQRFDTTLS